LRGAELDHRVAVHGADIAREDLAAVRRDDAREFCLPCQSGIALASVLLQGRKSANIHASSGVIRGIPESTQVTNSARSCTRAGPPALRRVQQQIAESLGGLRLCLKGAY
jgi:hypothetical protein